MGTIKNYYAGGNTNVGFYSLFDDVLKGLDRLYIIKGGPGTGKSTFMKKIGLTMAEKGYNVEFLHCSSDNNSLDGVIFPEIHLGLVDGTAPHVVDPKYPGVVDEIINLGEFWDKEKLRANGKRIIKLTNDISENFKHAYEQFAEAKLIHDEWEEIYLEAMDFNKANMVTEELINKIFVGDIEREDRPIIRRRFFGAATPKGAVHFIENITEDIERRYIVKGRPGSGKSTMMKKIGKRAESLGLSVEYFPCSFDPNSLDMVIIPKLSVAILDGTAPHVIDPSRPTDEVVDMFELCIDPQVEIEKAKELENVEQRYKIKMTIGTNHLKEAKRLHDELETYYIAAMDFAAIDSKREEILEEVLKYAEGFEK
ncbi:PRK06851 family protein [Tepidibacillus sp. LV47]|uniref:PRK06851 family protein n=1 Tax=Tepidibacillus sp. LV47 TaxID=3398228 RepID=UPI003AABB405